MNSGPSAKGSTLLAQIKGIDATAIYVQNLNSYGCYSGMLRRLNDRSRMDRNGVLIVDSWRRIELKMHMNLNLDQVLS